MKKTSVSGFFFVISLTAFTVIGCTPIPLYQPPGDNVPRAHIRIDAKDSSLVTGVMALRKVRAPLTCNQPMQVENMIIVSKGNPIVSDKNSEGVDIAAGQKMTLAAFGMTDGFPPCTTPFSFVPKSKSKYLLKLSSERAGGKAKSHCNIDLLEYSGNDIVDGAVWAVPTFQIEECVN